MFLTQPLGSRRPVAFAYDEQRHSSTHWTFFGHIEQTRSLIPHKRLALQTVKDHYYSAIPIYLYPRFLPQIRFSRIEEPFAYDSLQNLGQYQCQSKISNYRPSLGHFTSAMIYQPSTQFFVIKFQRRYKNSRLRSFPVLADEAYAWKSFSHSYTAFGADFHDEIQDLSFCPWKA